MVQIILENKRGETSYLWDPSAVILEEIKKIYKKSGSLREGGQGKGSFRRDRFGEAKDRPGDLRR